MSKPEGYIVHCRVCGELAAAGGEGKKSFLERSLLRKYWRYNSNNHPASIVHKYTCENCRNVIDTTIKLGKSGYITSQAISRAQMDVLRDRPEIKDRYLLNRLKGKI